MQACSPQLGCDVSEAVAERVRSEAFGCLVFAALRATAQSDSVRRGDIAASYETAARVAEVDPRIVDDVMRGFLREQSGDPYGQPGAPGAGSSLRPMA